MRNKGDWRQALTRAGVGAGMGSLAGGAAGAGLGAYKGYHDVKDEPEGKGLLGRLFKKGGSESFKFQSSGQLKKRPRKRKDGGDGSELDTLDTLMGELTRTKSSSFDRAAEQAARVAVGG